MNVSPEVIQNLIFLPYQPNAFNVPFGLFSAMFMHAGHGHLRGNILFLWAVDTVVGRRIGSLRFISFNLLTGVVTHLVYLFFCAILGNPAHSIGASGAIAGVMGLSVVRCYFKSMVFLLPISLKIRLNSLVIIGLFFLADLSGRIQQVVGNATDNTNHLTHLGWMLCGIFLANVFKLNEDAITERHMEIGSQAVNASVGTATRSGEESLRMLLQKTPQNVEALLMLARVRAYQKTWRDRRGADLYRKAIPLPALRNPDEAMLAYHEIDKLYMSPLDAETMYRLANIFHRTQDHEMTSRCLESVCKDEQAPAQMREKAFFRRHAPLKPWA